MPLSWNEIKQRAIAFAQDWSQAARERAEAQTFWNEFFNIFGVSRRKVACFEEPVRNLQGDMEFIDLFWPGRLIAEHKSRGHDLGKAHTQAVGYVQNLASAGASSRVGRSGQSHPAAASRPKGDEDFAGGVAQRNPR